MSGNTDVAVSGVAKNALAALIAHHGEGSIPAAARYDALARFEELPVRSAIRGGRTWKHDLAKLDLSTIVSFETRPAADLDLETLSPAARAKGVTIERFSVAREAISGRRFLRDSKKYTMCLDVARF